MKVDHWHCPHACEHPQPFQADGVMLCGRCWFVYCVRTECVPCGPGICGEGDAGGLNVTNAEVPKPELTGLFCDNDETREGKYLVLRRDNTVPKWPSFVLGARDPAAAWALWFYSWVAWLMGMNRAYCQGCNRRSWLFYRFRKTAGVGDPDKGRHRPDDPWVIARMREGMSS